jgi:hypothetical protein
MRRLLPLLFACAATTAHAQATRCEAPDGKITYVNGGCPAGTRAAKSVGAAPPASDADRKAAEARAAADRKQAEALSKQQRAADEKLAKERAAQAARDKKQTQECAKLELKRRHAQEDYDRAPPKSKDSAQVKLRRAGEAYAAMCPPG